MANPPNKMVSGFYREGHVQGVAVDAERGFVYYSFTTMLLKTDLAGNPVGSVIRLAGHLGCVTLDTARNRLYASLEIKHDSIGAGIIRRTGWDPTEEDAFYLVSFDCDAITHMDMNAERDGVMRAVYLRDVVADYVAVDEVSGRRHRYGCSGIDGIGLGPVFGAPSDSERKIIIAYGIYSELDREDNDYQVLLQYDPSVIDAFGAPLNQSAPHHRGPEKCEERYFFYTGNTVYGVQNLEYDPHSRNWFLAVYRGKKPCFENFPMFFIDGQLSPERTRLIGRGEEVGLLLSSAKIGSEGQQQTIRGSRFALGQTGMVAMGDGTFYFSRPEEDRNTNSFASTLLRYQYAPQDPCVFLPLEDFTNI